MFQKFLSRRTELCGGKLKQKQEIVPLACANNPKNSGEIYLR